MRVDLQRQCLEGLYLDKFSRTIEGPFIFGGGAILGGGLYIWTHQKCGMLKLKSFKTNLKFENNATMTRRLHALFIRHSGSNNREKLRRPIYMQL